MSYDICLLKYSSFPLDDKQSLFCHEPSRPLDGVIHSKAHGTHGDNTTLMFTDCINLRISLLLSQLEFNIQIFYLNPFQSIMKELLTVDCYSCSFHWEPNVGCWCGTSNALPIGAAAEPSWMFLNILFCLNIYSSLIKRQCLLWHLHHISCWSKAGQGVAHPPSLECSHAIQMDNPTAGNRPAGG